MTEALAGSPSDMPLWILLSFSWSNPAVTLWSDPIAYHNTTSASPTPLSETWNRSASPQSDLSKVAFYSRILRMQVIDCWHCYFILIHWVCLRINKILPQSKLACLCWSLKRCFCTFCTDLVIRLVVWPVSPCMNMLLRSKNRAFVLY